MSATYVFPTKWHFLVARVLIGVDRDSGVFTGVQQDGADLVCVWTSEEGVRRDVDEARFDVKQVEVAQLLRMLPPTVGVLVDPGSEGAMRVPPDYAQQLRPLTEPFPVGATLTVRPWVDLPDAVATRIRDGLAERPFVTGAHALLYAVDDSPYQGIIAYAVDGSGESEESAINAVVRALGDTTLDDLDVINVRIMAAADLPDDVRAQLPAESVLYARA